MTNAAIRRSASAAIAALMMAVGAAVAVAPAHADPNNDQVFIDYLNKKGVPYGNRTEIIRLAIQSVGTMMSRLMPLHWLSRGRYFA